MRSPRTSSQYLSVFGDLSNIIKKFEQENKVMVNAMIPEQLGHHHTIKMNAANETEKPAPITASAATVPCRRWIARYMRLSSVLNTIICAAVLLFVAGSEFGFFPQKKLGFICKDPNISHPYMGDTIKPLYLILICYLGPLLFICISEAMRERSVRNVRIGVVWKFFREVMIGAHFVLLITEITKIVVGENRPHFFDTCQPDTNLDCKAGSFVAHYTCTNRNYSNFFLTDSSRSFPSGHSSISVFISVFVAYIVYIRMPSALLGKMFKLLMMVVCLSWAIVCSFTRITDRRHHWWDVLAGLVIGLMGVSCNIVLFHQKMQHQLHKSQSTVSSTMLLDIKNKEATSVRV